MKAVSWPSGTHYVDEANLTAAFFEGVTRGGDAPLLYEKREQTWQAHTWNEVADTVRRLAGVLVQAGVGSRRCLFCCCFPETFCISSHYML